MAPPAPKAFSTTTVAPPNGLRNASAMSRAKRSVGPPAVKGTTKVMGLSLRGNVCAKAEPEIRLKHNKLLVTARIFNHFAIVGQTAGLGKNNVGT